MLRFFYAEGFSKFEFMYRTLLFLIIIICLGCKTKTKQILPSPPVIVQQKEEVHNFFPVTAYLKGQIADLRNQGINPILYRTIRQKQDSSWVKSEDFDALFQPFLVPVIDSTNQSGTFVEKSFVDQTINAITFSYDPRTALPDSATLRRWDVYIDPETQKVTRIYLVRKLPSGHLQQLTWQSGKWCKMLELDPNKDGNAATISQEQVKWDF